MKSGFVIIGLTGALGSGCTTIAEFLSKSLLNYKKDIQSVNQAVESQIGKYYRALKEKENKYNSKMQYFDQQFQDIFIEPEDLYHTVSDKDKLETTEKKLKILNRQLRTLLLQRKLFEYYSSVDWSDFENISMSTLIIKLAVEQSIKNDSEKTETSDELLTYLKSNKDFLSGAKDQIVDFAKKNINIIEKYNKLSSYKNYGDLNDEVFCKEIDQFFHGLVLLKKRLIAAKDVGPEWLQDLGDNLRGTGSAFKSYIPEEKKKFDHLDILSNEANKLIKFYRRRLDGKRKNHFVIDSFRNPEEVQFFRKRYGSFFLCSLYANKELRKKRAGEFLTDRCEKRDRGKYKATIDLHKQNVPDCVLLSDYAINNDSDDDAYKNKMIKLLCLIDKPGLVYPTVEEVSMNLAYNVSLRSTCISRQVGAVITNSDGFVIATGWNDVGSGQLGCSLNCIDDYTKYSNSDSLLSVWRDKYQEFRNDGLFADYQPNSYFCFKDIESKSFSSKKIDKAYKKFCKTRQPEENLQNSSHEELLSFIKQNISIKRLEYARALHAEENAILQAARFGGMGISGGTIYSTTFPCELCAKKIYQSQIKRIVYTEPYPESISEKIFLKDGVRQIKVEQFEGVKSSSFFKLYKAPFNLKESQMLDNLI
jgi:dCMP deaminase